MCGTPTQVSNKEVATVSQQSDYVRRSDVKILDGLREVMDSMIVAKRLDPSTVIMAITEDDGYINNHEYCVEWIIGPQCTYTNNASIILYFWYKKAEEIGRIKQLENAFILSHDEIDCGTDIEKAAYLFSEYVRKVWLYDGDVRFESVEIEKASFDSVELYLSKDASNQWKELEALVNGYNALAKGNGYPMLSMDSNQYIFKGSFPTNKKVGFFLSKSAMTHKKMKAKFKKILSLCHTCLKDWQ